MSNPIGGPGIQTTSPAVLGKARQQATELEGVFMNTLMKEMFATVKTDENGFGGGFAEETWRGMQAEQLSAQMAESGGIGLADSILADLIAIQEANQNAKGASN
jgi:Rod binding domain-containing protein